MKTYVYEDDWIIQIRGKMKKRYMYDIIFGIVAFLILFGLLTTSPKDFDNKDGTLLILVPMAALFRSVKLAVSNNEDAKNELLKIINS